MLTIKQEHDANIKTLASKTVKILINDISDISSIKPSDLALLSQLEVLEVITHSTTKDIIKEIYKTGKSALDIVDSGLFTEVCDTSFLEVELANMLSKLPESVNKYKSGETKLMGFFIGKAKERFPRTDAKTLKQLIEKILKNSIDERM